MIREKIISVAKGFLGQLEKPGNMGFQDPVFDAKMRAVGFMNTHAWCAYAAELVYTDAEVLPITTLRRLHSAGAVRTYRNYAKAFPSAVSKLPSIGALVAWRKMVNGKPDPQGRGHIGVCETGKRDGNTFKTFEGNTNKAGSREGDQFAEKIRSLDAFNETNGLQLLGFIDPVECVRVWKEMNNA